MRMAHAATCSAPREGSVSGPPAHWLRRLRGDEEGAVMVIAIFMAAVLVGVIWYTFGLGEAMLFRQQMRAAVDAAAFDSSVVHALGMNILAMMNIVMAAVLSILVLLMIIFVGALLITALAVALLFVPIVDVAAAAALPELLEFDEGMFDVIEAVQPWVFGSLTVLNASEGAVAIIMPWVGFIASNTTADSYGGAVTSTSSFSPSMIPMRAPFFSNVLDQKLKSKLPTIPLPGGAKLQTALKVPLLQRYGLPVQDDIYGMLCMHAGMELVDEVATMLGDVGAPSGITGKFGQILGQVVGAVPWMFCSGVDPADILNNLLGGFSGPMISNSRVFSNILAKAKDLTGKAHPSMFPMKPFDETSNGGDFQQVWSSATGSETLGSGAITGVAIAGGPAASPTNNEGGDNQDFAEAEFYFDCGGPDGGRDQTVLGTSDTSGDWQECKYNAMWNMEWKSRMRRYHQFQWDIRKDIDLSLYQGLGVDGFIKGLLPASLQEGSLAKIHVLDPVKACITSLGSGSRSGEGDMGSCPLPIGRWKWGNGGKIGLGPDSPDGYSMDQVLH